MHDPGGADWRIKERHPTFYRKLPFDAPWRFSCIVELFRAVRVSIHTELRFCCVLDERVLPDLGPNNFVEFGRAEPKWTPKPTGTIRLRPADGTKTPPYENSRPIRFPPRAHARATFTCRPADSCRNLLKSLNCLPEFRLHDSGPSMAKQRLSVTPHHDDKTNTQHRACRRNTWADHKQKTQTERWRATLPERIETATTTTTSITTQQ